MFILNFYCCFNFELDFELAMKIQIRHKFCYLYFFETLILELIIEN